MPDNPFTTKLPFTIKQLRGALMVACAALMVVAGSASMVRAADDDDEDVPYDTKLLRGIMHGLGLRRDGEGPNIDYRERSPLVVPPSISLPPPQTASTTPNAANWPVDQEEKRRKAAAAARKKATSYQVEDEWRVLSEKDLTPGAGTAAARQHPKPQSGRGTEADDMAAEGRRLSAKELGYKGDMILKSLFGSDDKGEMAKFEGEPARTSLIEPPAGYRTPSPAQPYGVVANAKKNTKPESLIDRMTPIEDRR